jgi:hypothetical protein
MEASGVRVLIIDEVHNVLAGSYREQRIVLNTLRFLSNRLQISLLLSKASAAELSVFKAAVGEAYDFAEAKGYSPVCLFTPLAEIVREMETTIAERQHKYSQAHVNGWRLVAGYFTLIPMKTSSSAQAAMRANKIMMAQW